MPLITLLKKGALRANTADPIKQEELDQIVPIDYIMNWFSDRINLTGIANRILVLKSDTGSGKSTAFPPVLYKTFYKTGAGNIAVTQPRVLNAINIVRDQITGSGFYPYMKLGENIGWQTGPSKKKSKNGLIYMTLGVLMRQLKTFSDEQLMATYRFIIIDEVHEASMDQSIVLFMLRSFVARNAHNPKMPFIVLTSATLNVDLFLNYFGVYDAPAQPNLIQVAGFAYALEERWTFENTTSDYIESAFLTAKKIHEENPQDADNRDILIFLPSKTEMIEVSEKLQKYREKLNSSGKPIFAILQIDSETIKKNGQDFADMTADITTLRAVIAHKPIPVSRRIILSTSVAETGITIDTLKYVIDCGFHRGPEYNPHYRVSGVLTKPSQHSRIRQRKGRANRKAEGVFYPLYPKYVYEKLPTQQLADIETSDISEYAIGLFHEQSKELDYVDFNINLLNKPPVDTAREVFERLYALGYISPASDYKYTKTSDKYSIDLIYKIVDSQREIGAQSQQNPPNLTKLGAIAALLGDIKPEISRMILAAYAWDCSPVEMTTIAAYISLDYSDFTTKKPIDWITIYRTAFYDEKLHTANFKKIEQNQLPLEDPKIYYIYRLIIADDFIDGLVLFQAVSRVIQAAFAQRNGQAPNLSIIGVINDWCDRVNIKKDGVLLFIKRRDELLESIITAGLSLDFDSDNSNGKNPTNKLFPCKCAPAELINTITKIKYCIYEGFRLNAAFLSENGEYKTLSGVSISLPNILRDNEVLRDTQRKCGVSGHISKSPKPNYILYDAAKFKLDKKTQIFKIKTDRISVLDGFVKNDLEFL